jgi:heat shock protein HslJ
MRVAIRRLVAVLSLVGVLAGLASCSSSSQAPSGLSSASLAGKTFVSTSVTGHDLVAGTKVTLQFDGPTLVASAGCNTMSAAYMLDNSTLRWSGPARSTLIGCPPALAAQDHWLAGFLQAGAAALLTGHELSLSSSPTTMRLQAQ